MFRKVQKIFYSTHLISSLSRAHYPNPCKVSKLYTYSHYYSISTLQPFVSNFSKFLKTNPCNKEASDRVLTLLAYGEVYVGAFEFKKARVKFNEALELSQIELGSEGVETALSLHRLGDLYQIEGAYQRSLELYTRAIEIYQKDVSSNYSLIASLNRSIGLFYKHTEEYSSSLNYLIKAMQTWSTLEDYEQAQDSIRFALEILDKEDSVPLEQKIQVYEIVGDIYLQVGKLDKAKANLSKASDLKSKIYKQSDPKMGSLSILLGLLKLKEENMKEGVKLVGKGLKLCNKRKEKDTLLLARAYTILGCIEQKNEDHSKALEHFDSAYNLLICDMNGQFDIKIAKVLSYMGDAYYSLNDLNHALARWQRSADILEKKSYGDIASLSTLYNNLGTLYLTMEDNYMAIQSLEKSVKLREELGDGVDILESAFLLRKLGMAYANMFKFDNAKQCFERSLGIYNKELGGLHEETCFTEALLQGAKTKMVELQRLDI